MEGRGEGWVFHCGKEHVERKREGEDLSFFFFGWVGGVASGLVVLRGEEIVSRSIVLSVLRSCE